MQQLPKLDLDKLKSGWDKSVTTRNDNTTNRRPHDDYRWIFQGSSKRSPGEPVDHWKLSVKPLRDFETFPNEWLGDIKSLKLRLGQLRSDIHSVFRNNSNKGNNY